MLFEQKRVKNLRSDFKEWSSVMEGSLTKRNKRRLHRLRRIKKRIYGTLDRPRLCVNKTCKHIYVQVVDDDKAHSMCAMSTLSACIRGDDITHTKGKMRTLHYGALLADYLVVKLKEANIMALCVDRRYGSYHGIVAVVVGKLRDAGISV